MIELSAILVVGPLRQRAQRVVDALGAQTAAGRIETIIVDTAPADTPALKVLNLPACKYLRRPDLEVYAAARCAGVGAAEAAVVAFIEDHCIPDRNWAAALIEAHRGDWAAVGYSFTNPDPDNFWCRASMVNDYGLWLHPTTPDPVELMPGNNISYKREVLISLDGQMERLLTPDYNLQQLLLKQRKRMRTEPAALAAHQGFKRLGPAMRANFSYARLLAGRRAQMQQWTRPRRMLQAILTPPLAPLLGSLRLIRSLRGRWSLTGQFIEGLPIYFVIHTWSSIGETLGYLFGEASAERDWNEFELLYDRD